MLFSSMLFLWIFLPIVWIGNFLLNKIGGCRFANILLLITSIFFYAWGEPVYVFLMLFSIFINWLLGVVIDKIDKTIFRRLVLILAIVINISLLGYFKYAAISVSTINRLFRTAFALPSIALPIGISFFTFQALSYVIDVFKEEVPAQKNIFKLGLYISFFPQLIAGPIVKYKDISEQIDHRTLSVEQTSSGIRRFIYGLGKKVLISNTLAACAEPLYLVAAEEESLLHIEIFLLYLH